MPSIFLISSLYESFCKKIRNAAIVYFSAVALLSVACYSFADDLEFEGASLDFDIEKIETQWLPGERYNGLKGVMNYAHTDLYLPGNGKLPIEITRVFKQRRVGGGTSPVGSFGMMYLAIPSVRYRVMDGGNQVCADSGRTSSTSSLSSPITFSHGESEQVFFGGAHGQQFRSADGWRMDCIPSSDRVTRTGNLMVYSPRGITYEMHTKYTVPSPYHAFQVHKITDPYGNTLTYDYSRSGPTAYSPETRLDSIVASDGRRVDIRYKQVRVPIGVSNFREVFHIDTIISNGANPVSLNTNM